MNYPNMYHGITMLGVFHISGEGGGDTTQVFKVQGARASQGLRASGPEGVRVFMAEALKGCGILGFRGFRGNWYLTERAERV